MSDHRVMGIVNVTPDSFSDGGRFLRSRDAIEHGLRLAREGAHILDVGGESTRPGAEPVSEREERERVLPVVEALAERAPGVQISIDTSKAGVAAAALAAGASLVNDVTAFRADPEMAGVVAAAGVDCCLMHMLGEPRTMQQRVGPSTYRDVVAEVGAFLQERMELAQREGIAPERIMLDPGIGFGKTAEHNLQLLRGLRTLAAIGPPIVVGTSRKTFLGRIIADARGDEPPVAIEERLPGTIATNVLALANGASVFRVHEVAPVRDALAVAAATFGRQWQASGPARTPTS